MQKRYSKEFKETLIAFYHSGQSVTQLSKEYDVAPLARNLSLSKDVVFFIQDFLKNLLTVVNGGGCEFFLRDKI
jgi:transposase